MPRLAFAFLALRFVAIGQGTEPKAKAQDYAAHERIGDITIGAENLGHSLPIPDRPLFTPDYLVVEVALFSEGNKPFSVDPGQFSLRLNEKKVALMPQSPGLVASSIKYPDWETRPELVGTAGIGDAQVGIGRTPSVERFPGDRRTARPPPGGIPRVPDPQDRSGIERPPPMSIDDAVQRATLPAGVVHPPVSGFLYFFYKGKLKSIKAMELIYDGPAGKVVLPLP